MARLLRRRAANTAEHHQMRMDDPHPRQDDAGHLFPESEEYQGADALSKKGTSFAIPAMLPKWSSAQRKNMTHAPNSSIPPEADAGKALVMLVAYLLCIFIPAAFCGVLIARLIQGVDAGWAEFLVDAGPGRITRRLLVLWAIVWLPFFLRKCGWRGWKDTGWKAPEATAPAHRPVADIWRGVVFGASMLTVLFVFIVALGVRVPVRLTWGGVLSQSLSFIASAVLISVGEETFSRGILFRTFSRSWQAWIAAIVTSMIFAAAHFIDPPPVSFSGGSVFGSTFRVLGTLFSDALMDPRFFLRFLNLTLLGCLLCACVARTGTIWFAVGLHAGLVWVMKMNAYLSDTDPFAAYQGFMIGIRPDMTDGLSATIVIVLMMVGVLQLRGDKLHRSG